MWSARLVRADRCGARSESTSHFNSSPPWIFCVSLRLNDNLFEEMPGCHVCAMGFLFLACIYVCADSYMTWSRYVRRTSTS